MNPHYYWIKKAVRKQGEKPLTSYKINAKDFKGNAELMKGLQEQFGIQSYEELNDLHYIVVN